MFTVVSKPRPGDHQLSEGQPRPQVINHRAGWKKVATNARSPDLDKQMQKERLETELQYKKRIQVLENEIAVLMKAYDETSKQNKAYVGIIEHGPAAVKVKRLNMDRKELKSKIEKLEEENETLKDAIKDLEKKSRLRHGYGLEEARLKRRNDDQNLLQGPFHSKSYIKEQSMNKTDEGPGSSRDHQYVRIDDLEQETHTLLDKIQELKQKKNKVDHHIKVKGAFSRNFPVAKALKNKLEGDISKYEDKLEMLSTRLRSYKRDHGLVDGEENTETRRGTKSPSQKIADPNTPARSPVDEKSRHSKMEKRNGNAHVKGKQNNSRTREKQHSSRTNKQTHKSENFGETVEIRPDKSQSSPKAYLSEDSAKSLVAEETSHSKGKASNKMGHVPGNRNKNSAEVHSSPRTNKRHQEFVDMWEMTETQPDNIQYSARTKADSIAYNSPVGEQPRYRKTNSNDRKSHVQGKQNSPRSKKTKDEPSAYARAKSNDSLDQIKRDNSNDQMSLEDSSDRNTVRQVARARTSPVKISSRQSKTSSPSKRKQKVHRSTSRDSDRDEDVSRPKSANKGSANSENTGRYTHGPEPIGYRKAGVSLKQNKSTEKQHANSARKQVALGAARSPYPPIKYKDKEPTFYENHGTLEARLRYKALESDSPFGYDGFPIRPKGRSRSPIPINFRENLQVLDRDEVRMLVGDRVLRDIDDPQDGLDRRGPWKPY